MPMPKTEAPGRLQAELMARGVRMTRQRRTILGVIETAKQHLDASQILRKAQRLDPSIDRVTVYRTLKLLKRHGLVDELDLLHLRGDGHYYERRPQRDHPTDRQPRPDSALDAKGVQYCHHVLDHVVQRAGPIRRP